jgi:primosomal protein N'
MKIQVQLDGRQWYTYSAPDSLAVNVGDKVTVPGLWSDTAVGVVRQIGSDYEGPLKSIYGVIERAKPTTKDEETSS